jgi:hypothetical protein
VQKQAQALITDALRTANVDQFDPVLIVLDALDECDKEGGREGGDIIPLLFHHLFSLPFRIKVIITSRPEASIRKMLDEGTSPVQPYILHNIGSALLGLILSPSLGPSA